MRRLFESLFRLFYGSRMQRFEGIPGPTPVFPFGTLLELLQPAPWDVCTEYEKKYGGLTLIWVGGRPTLVLNDPDLIRDVLVTKFEDYYKDDPIKALRPTLRNSLFVNNPPEWNPLRKAHPCCIHGFDEWLPTQLPVIKKVVDQHLERLMASTGEVDILDKMQRMCFDVFNACVIGRQLEDDAFRQFYITSITATRRMKLPKWLLFPPINPVFHRAMRRHYGAFEKIVKEVKQDLASDANDLLHVLLRQGTEVSDTQLATLVANIQAGGNFSAAATLVNTFYLLNHHPEVANELYAGLREFIQRTPDYDLAALEQYTFVDHVLRESLRYIAPVPIYFRNVLKTKATRLGDHELPPDTVVYILTRAVQRSAKHWKEPDQFDPSRWGNGTVEANPLDSDYFFPFGRGPRMCPGADLAMFCMKIALTSMLSRVAVKVDTSLPYPQVFHCGVAEPKGLKARIVPHETSPARETELSQRA